jgi:hypothetical protein
MNTFIEPKDRHAAITLSFAVEISSEGRITPQLGTATNSNPTTEA